MTLQHSKDMKHYLAKGLGWFLICISLFVAGVMKFSGKKIVSTKQVRSTVESKPEGGEWGASEVQISWNWKFVALFLLFIFGVCVLLIVRKNRQH